MTARYSDPAGWSAGIRRREPGNLRERHSEQVGVFLACRALRSPRKALYLPGPVYWTSHNDRNFDRLVRVGPARDPLFFITGVVPFPILLRMRRRIGRGSGEMKRQAAR